MEQQISANWRKSTFSSGNGGACIEVANADLVLVRDTVDRTFGTLTFTPDAWAAFTASIKR
jgi:Domain of unknown function (DUF397)